MSVLTHDRLVEILRYDPQTGLWVWVKRSRTGPNRVGHIAGYKDPVTGYIFVKIDGRKYLSHRLAFFYMKKRWPEPEADHENLDQSDNRWCNIREAGFAQNRINRRRQKNNQSGFKGVSWNKTSKRWIAYLSVGGKNKHLGCFKTPELAHAAYLGAAQKQYGEFARGS